MIFNTNLEALASKIPPIVIIQHLESTGWKFFETKRKDIAVYQYTTDAVFEQVTVPLDKHLSDFSYAMYSAAKSIAGIEGKPVEQVILELLNPNADVWKIRLMEQDTELGSVLLDRAGDL